MRGARGRLSHLRSDYSGCCLRHRILVYLPVRPFDSLQLLTGGYSVVFTASTLSCRDSLPVEGSVHACDTQVSLCRAGGGS